jgi:arsenate reductase
LKEHRLPLDGLRSKSWQEFAASDAPAMEFIVTVCDNAAAETCPVWPGHPVTEHWGLPDPATVEGSEEEKRRAFHATLAELKRRIQDFVSRHP